MPTKKRTRKKKEAAVAVPEESLSLHERLDRLEEHTFKKKKPTVKRSPDAPPEPEPEPEDDPEHIEDDPEE